MLFQDRLIFLESGELYVYDSGKTSGNFLSHGDSVPVEIATGTAASATTTQIGAGLVIYPALVF